MFEAMLQSFLNLCMWTGAGVYALAVIRGAVASYEHITERIQRARWRRQHRQMWPELYAHDPSDGTTGTWHGMLARWAEQEYDEQRAAERGRSHMQRQRLAEWSLRDSLHSDPHGAGDADDTK